jgi:hypothetical protein
VEDKSYPSMLRGNEAMELLKSVNDPITNQLMNMANFEVLRRFLERDGLPISDFDLRFFMEAMKDFCSQHDTIRKILAGEDLRAWTDDHLQD